MQDDHDVIDVPQKQPSTAGALAGFSGTDLSVRAAGEASIAVREEAEMKAAIVLARTNPRNELDGYNRVIKSCKRAGFAATALYSFPRGGQKVEGPSVDMAREIARAWGNIRYGLRIVEMSADAVHIRGFAHDVETNAYVEMEDKFARLVQRKDKRTNQTTWVQPDERDLRELINRRGAICVRNAILQVLPPDVVDDALAECRRTREAGAMADLKDRDRTLKMLVLAFNDVGVSVEMLERRLGHALAAIDDKELADLRGVFKSIKDGNTSRSDHFSFGHDAQPQAPSASSSAIDAIELPDDGAAGKPEVTPPAPAAPAGKPKYDLDGNVVDDAKAAQLAAEMVKVLP